MSRLTTFLFGAACGGALVFTGLKYHVVRVGEGLDGIIFVRKLAAEFAADFAGPEKNVVSISQLNSQGLKIQNSQPN